MKQSIRDIKKKCSKIADAQNELLLSIESYLVHKGIDKDDVDFTYDNQLRVHMDENYEYNPIMDALLFLDGVTVDRSCDKYSLINLN